MARHRSEENLRDRILDACSTQLAGGAMTVTVREVAAAAGVSNGTLYHYFPSLDDLLLAVAARAASVQQDSFGDPAEGVAEIIQRLFDPQRRDTILPLLRQRAAASPELAEALATYDEDVNSQYADALRAASTDLGLRDGVDIEAAVEVIRALAEGFQLRASSNTLILDASRFTATVLDLIATTWFTGSLDR